MGNNFGSQVGDAARGIGGAAAQYQMAKNAPETTAKVQLAGIAVFVIFMIIFLVIFLRAGREIGEGWKGDDTEERGRRGGGRHRRQKHKDL